MPTHLDNRTRSIVRPQNYQNYQNIKSLGLNLGLCVAVFICTGIWLTYGSETRSRPAKSVIPPISSSPTSDNSAQKKANPIERIIPQELPPTGVLQEPSLSETDGFVPLRIFLRAPLAEENSSLPTTCSDANPIGESDKKHRLIKVVDWDSNQVVTTAFVRSGEMVEILVPYGSYKLRYAAGTRWYGEKAMFGSKYIYEMTEPHSSVTTKLDFTPDKAGVEIGAYCSQGNLGVKTIREDAAQDSI